MANCECAYSTADKVAQSWKCAILKVENVETPALKYSGQL